LNLRIFPPDADSLEGVDVIITNGGTGISLRDSAFEMVSELLVKTVDGFGELFRMVPLFPPFWVLVGLDPI